MKTLIHPTAVIHPGAELHPTVQVGPYAVIGASESWSGNCAWRACGAGGTDRNWCTNQIFPGAAIGLEPQDLKYDGSKTQVKLVNRIRSMSLLIAQRGLVKRR